jgi:hypothetical protein
MAPETIPMDLTRSLKVYLRLFEIHGTTLRVVTLRPQHTVRFSTNYFHGTWHLLGGVHGAMVMGRLMWGLAFQRLPGTVVLVDESHLVPTPFEADRPDPILIVPDGLTTVDDDLLRALRLRLRRCPGPPTTIRWHTFGMVRALAQEDRRERRRWSPELRRIYLRERMSRRAGFVTYTAPPTVLRETGLSIYQMHRWGTGYLPLAGERRTSWHGTDGEFQLIDDFDDNVGAAIVARREVVGDDGPNTLLAETDVRWNIYQRKELLVRRRQAARR